MSKKDTFFLVVIVALATGWATTAYHRAQEPPRPAAHGSAAITGGPMCAEHKVPEAKCGFCHPELTETLGFCKGHGVPEVFCYQCDPDLVPAFKAAGDWCAPHARPESQCAICNVGGADVGEANVGEADAHAGHGHGAASHGDSDTDEAHAGHDHGPDDHEGDEPPPGPRGALPVTAPPGPPSPDLPRHLVSPDPTCATHDLRVRFRAPEIEAKTGLELVTLARGPLAETLEANAVLTFDRNRFAHLTPRTAGFVAEVRADVGDRVEAGEVLAIIDSRELGTAKATLLQARASEELWRRNRDREEGLRRHGVAAERTLLEAETRLTETRIARTGAEQQLRNLGLSDEDIARVAREGETSSRLPVLAPFAGEVVARHAVPGEVVDPRDPIFHLTDPAALWARIDLYEEDLQSVRVGQRATVSFDGLPGREFAGPVTWISRSLDPRTRTLEARVVLDNSSDLLRAEMFGSARIELRRADTVIVPADAVQWDGTCNTVFVREEAGAYEPRRVKLGFRAGDSYEVVRGLEAGEVVVTTGSFLLKTEVMKGSIGSGCCEVEAPRS